MTEEQQRIHDKYARIVRALFVIELLAIAGALATLVY
jgi:hypothetical protein